MRGIWCKNDLCHNPVCNAATSIANRITDYLTLIASFYIVNCRNETHEYLASSRPSLLLRGADGERLS